MFGNVDDGGDMILPGAFTETLAEGLPAGRIKLLLGHNEDQMPIGKPLDIHEDAVGLYVKCQISDTQLGRDVRTLVKDGALSEMSIAYDPISFEYDESGVRLLKKLKLWEVSIVTWGMNPQAQITGYKGGAAGAVGAKRGGLRKLARRAAYAAMAKRMLAARFGKAKNRAAEV